LEEKRVLRSIRNEGRKIEGKWYEGKEEERNKEGHKE
jgi:hypothetical protein